MVPKLSPSRSKVAPMLTRSFPEVVSTDQAASGLGYLPGGHLPPPKFGHLPPPNSDISHPPKPNICLFRLTAHGGHQVGGA